MIRSARNTALVLTCAAALAACSGSPATSSARVGSSATAASAAASAATSTTAGKVSANAASTAEIVAALEAAGVPNADRWAREVEEYRSYDTSDPTLQSLQDNLAKYHPDPETLAGILGAMQP